MATVPSAANGSLGSGSISNTGNFNFTGVAGVALPLANGSSYGAWVSGDGYYAYLGAWAPGLGGSSCTNSNSVGKSTFSTIDNTIPRRSPSR